MDLDKELYDKMVEENKRLKEQIDIDQVNRLIKQNKNLKLQNDRHKESIYILSTTNNYLYLENYKLKEQVEDLEQEIKNEEDWREIEREMREDW